MRQSPIEAKDAWSPDIGTLSDTSVAKRLLSALARAQRNEGTPQTIGELREEAGLGEITPLICEMEGQNQ